ncbi:MAG: fumarylacetoacetate hydrolase family protein [Flavobacteriaceae bacterium]|nr:fumarylacetoacetate hydrolase family protein [Flavobacteriaceae bacterium]
MKLICIGRNYADHITELANQRPSEPVIFIKPDTAVLNEEAPFVIPDFSENVHHEVELIIKISKTGKHITPEFASQYFDEIGLGIDFTARDLQDQLKSKGLPWEKSKAFDNSAVVGSFLPKSNFSDLNNIPFSLQKNGETVQDGNASLMLWKMEELICYISTFFTLKKGDLIFTGTPAGVGKVNAGDFLEGFINKQLMFTTKVI